MQGTPFAVDPASWIQMRLHPFGRAARLGRDHLIEAGVPAGELCRLDDWAALARLLIKPQLPRLDVGALQTEIRLSWRGSVYPPRVPVIVERRAMQVAVAGELRARWGEPGIMPFAVLGGASQVCDEVRVDFRVIGRNSSAAL